MIKLIAVIDSVRGMVEDRPAEIVAIWESQLTKTPPVSLFRADSGLFDIKTTIETIAALEQPVYVLGNALELELALPYAQELFIIQVDGIFDTHEYFPKFEDKFYMEKRKPIQEADGVLYQCQCWKPDSTHLQDTWDVDIRDNV